MISRYFIQPKYKKWCIVYWMQSLVCYTREIELDDHLQYWNLNARIFIAVLLVDFKPIAYSNLLTFCASDLSMKIMMSYTFSD